MNTRQDSIIYNPNIWDGYKGVDWSDYAEKEDSLRRDREVAIQKAAAQKAAAIKTAATKESSLNNTKNLLIMKSAMNPDFRNTDWINNINFSSSKDFFLDSIKDTMTKDEYQAAKIYRQQQFSKNRIKDLANQYKLNLDYIALAELYEREYKFGDPAKQSAFERKLRNLRMEGHKVKAILDNPSVDRDAYLFKTHINKGILPENNIYGDSFRELMNNFGGSKAAGMMVTFDKDYFDTWYNKSQYHKTLYDNFIKDGGTVTTISSGKRTFFIDKTNPYAFFILSSLPLESTDYSYSNNSADPSAVALTVKEKNYYTIAAYDSKLNILGDKRYSISEITDSKGRNVRNIQEAVQNANANIKNIYKDTKVIHPAIVTPYMHADHQMLVQKLDLGQISREDFNAGLKYIKEATDAMIQQSSFTQYDKVYANLANDKDATLREVTSSEDKDYLTDLVKNAIQENRLVYNAAMVNGEIGTYFTIMSKTDDKEGKFYTGEKDTRGGYTIFVPGYFQGGNEDVILNDTKTRAIKELSQMATYKYTYVGLDGTEISNVTSNSATLRTKDGYKMNVSMNEAINALNKNFILEDGLRMFGNQMENIKDATKYTLSEPLDKIDMEVYNYAASAASEIVGNTNSKEYRDIMYDLYTRILNDIGYTQARMIQVNSK